MKKITIAIFILLGSFSMASAELGVNIGISAQLGTMDASATEGSTDTLVRQTEKGEVLFGTGSFFIEKELSFLPGPLARLSIGYDNIAHDIDLGTATNVSMGVQQNVGNEQVGFTNQVSATIDGFSTVYGTINITDWLYVKGGNVTVDVKTTEGLESGGSYDNASLDGTVFGFGLHKESENGLFFRLEYNDYSIDGVTLLNKGAKSSRSVTLKSVEGETGRISVGKAF